MAPTLLVCELQLVSSDKRNVTLGCAFDSFSCTNGTCLASTSLCDGQMDCISGEDEGNCRTLVNIGSYKCRDGKIITADKHCNLIADCADGEDEVNCFYVTNGCTQMFRCRSGQCVNLKDVCDGFFHCVDHSDESACLESCNFGFVCNDSSCVLQHVKDDLVPDCRDKSDEPLFQMLLNREIDQNYRCPKTKMIPCEVGHNRCFPVTRLCILEYDIHNNITPCRNGAHLKHCKHFSCTGSFKCPHSYCVPLNYFCNGRFDCPNGEDESGCPNGHIQCPGLLRCKDGGCIHPSKTCDGIVNCPNGDDERCIIKCPPNCICKGLVLICTALNGSLSLQISPSHLYLQLSSKIDIELIFSESLTGLKVLDLSNNSFTKVPKDISKLVLLSYLDMSNNLVAHISSGIFMSSNTLAMIKLKGNLIKSISDDTFQGLSALPHLDLSEQKLFLIENNGFKYLSQLQTLDLSDNELTELKSDWFSPLKDLVYLYLIGNDFLKIDPQLFNKLMKLEILHTSSSALCCLTNGSLSCVVDSIETSQDCDRIIPSTAVLVLGLLLCCIILVSNSIVILLRSTSSKTNSNSLIIVNLAVSDTVQGVYLAIIISNDLLYYETYGLIKWEWRNSMLCSAVGFGFSFCSCQSAISTIVIALDRYKVIATPFASITEGSGKKARLFIILVTWIVSAFVASVPFIPLTLVPDYQMTPTDICFIHLYDNKYSTYLTVYINVIYGVALPLVCCFLIAIYIRMVYKLRMSAASAGRSVTTSDYYKMCISFSLVCSVNLISSWALAVVTYLSDAGVTMETSTVNEALLIITSLPAILNSFVYTIATSYISDYFKKMRTLRRI